MYRSLTASVLFLATTISSALAQECSGAVQFDDAFETLDPGWGKADEFVKASGGKLTVKAEPNLTMLAPNMAFAFTSGEVCTDLTLTNETADPRAATAGLLFWYSDKKNFYKASITPAGDLSVSRLLDGKWVTAYPYTASPDVKKGANQANSLAVRFEGQSVTVFVNGKEQTKLKLQPPSGQTFIGAYVGSPEESSDAWDFTKFRVTAVK